MNRGYFIGVAALVAAGVAASIVLKPEEKEMAFMQLQDKHLGKALHIYEEKYAGGDRSVSVVIPLAKVYAEHGDIEKAVEVMEAFVETHPDSLEARKQLGLYYGYSQQPEKAMETLETIQRTEPDANHLRKLAEYYFFKNNITKQQESLEQLVHRYEPTEEELIRLANLYATQKAYAKATALFAGFSEKRIQGLQPYTLKTIASMMLDDGKDKEFTQIIYTYLKGSQSYDALVPVLAMMVSKGKLEQALALVQPYEAILTNHPRLLEEFASLEMAKGNTHTSFGLLQTLFRQHNLNGNLLDMFTEMAIFRGEENVVEKIIYNGSITLLPEKRLLNLAQFAMEHQRPDWVSAIRQKLGAKFMETHPATALAFALAEGQDISKIKVHIAELPPEPMATLVRMLVEANAKPLAKEMLAAWEPSLLSPDVDLLEVASFYFKLGEAKYGAEVFSRMETKADKRQKDGLEKGQLLLAAGIGDTASVITWVKRATLKDVPLLEYLYSISLEQKNKTLALGSAETLRRLQKNHQTTLYLADALLLNGDNASALSHLRPIYRIYREAAPSYIQALLKSQKTLPAAREELATFLESQQFMHLAPHQQRDIAYQLVDNGQIPTAEKIFFALAKKAPPTSPDVQELLYLWEKHIPEEGMSWLQQRLNTAPERDKLAWLSYCQQADMHGEIIAALQFHSFPLRPEALELYLNALYQTKQWDKLGEVIGKQAASNNNTKTQRLLVDYARASGQPVIMEKVYQTLETLHPEDAIMQREMGMLAYAQGKFSLAEKYLAAYLNVRNSDYRAHYYYAELLNRKGERAKAIRHFTKTRKLMVDLPRKDITIKLMDAAVHYRLGEKDKAFALFEKMMKEAPGNAELRETYANLLMDAGRYDEAETLLRKPKSF